MSKDQINRAELRKFIRKLPNDTLFQILDRAIDLLPQLELSELIKDYIDPSHLRRTMSAEPLDLLTETECFFEASIQGDYFESFDVSSKNCTEKSRGTAAFIADFQRLISCCIVKASEGNFSEAREALKILFDLLSRIDTGRDDIIFFADEGGSYEVGVDWSSVLPVWFTCLAATATPIEFAHEAIEVIDNFDKFRREEHLVSAFNVASADQRDALQNINK